MYGTDTVKIMTGHPYEVTIGSGILSHIGELLPQRSPCIAALVSDDIVIIYMAMKLQLLSKIMVILYIISFSPMGKKIKIWNSYPRCSAF